MEFFELKKLIFLLSTDKISKPSQSNKKKSFDVNLLNLKILNLNYEGRDDLFNEINLTINKNDIIGINGESGTGKSTIINILTGLIKNQERAK